MTKYVIYEASEVAGHDGESIGEPIGTIEGKSGQIIAECAATDEPFFPLRGKDIFSVMNIAHYLNLIEDFSPDDHEHMALLVDEVAAFKHWQRNNMDKVRYPD